MKRNKNVFIKLVMILGFFASGNLLIGQPEAAYAAPAGCYVSYEGTTTEATCPDEDNEGDPIVATNCYVAPVSNNGPGAFSEQDCDSFEVSGGGTVVDPESFCSENPELCTPISPGGSQATSDGTDGKQCGKNGADGDGSSVVLSIDIGCRGENYPSSGAVNPIIDMAFALFRFLSAGVGLVVIGSIILAGIQYSASRGNPQLTEASITRVTNSVIALLLYIFIFAIANFLVPGGMLF